MLTKNQIKGNWGEQFVAEQLAAHGCLVRHVPQGQDSGIDLYCESLTENGHPFLHFWCQVKTGSFPANEPKHSFRVPRAKLDYWRRQPIPVFLVLVPDRPNLERRMYICSIAHNLLASKPKSDRKSYVLQSRYPCPPLELGGFFEQILPAETVLWNLQHGKLSPIPKYPVREGQLKKFAVGVTALYENELKATLHFSLWRLAEDILARQWNLSNLTPKDSRSDALAALDDARPYVEALRAVVYGKKVESYQNFVTFGILAELDAEKMDAEAHLKKAKSYYEAAITAMRRKGLARQSNFKKYRNYINRVSEKLRKIPVGSSRSLPLPSRRSKS